MKSLLSRWRARRDAELARRTDQAARTKGHVAPAGLGDDLTALLDAVFAPNRTADHVNIPHRCKPGHACYDHQEPRP